jgi:orotate phosphoribosyltransferase
MDKHKSQLALDFYKLKAVKFSKEGFRFNLHADHPEAPLSPNYLNLRDVFRNPEIRKAIAKEIAPLVKKIKPDLLVDLPQSISHITTTVSDLTGIPMISIRSEALKKEGAKKDYGVAQNINGAFKKGQKALIIDDVVSSYAFTKMKAVAVLKQNKLKVIPKIIVIVDREEGGKENLKKMGYELIRLLDLKDMLKAYQAKKWITEEEYEKSLRFADMAKKFALNDETHGTAKI